MKIIDSVATRPGKAGKFEASGANFWITGWQLCTHIQ